MSFSPTSSGVRLSRTLVIDVIAPLALFYGLRAAGTNQLLALIAGAVLPAANALREMTTQKRISGIRLFVLGVMASTVAASVITGSPRALLIRSAVLMGALGAFLVVSLRGHRRPFLYEAARVVFTEDKQYAWAQSWDRYPAFQRLLWLCSAFWAAGCLLDAAIRLGLALALPVDAVPALDAGLLVATLVVLMTVQRVFGRAYLRRHGLRMDGARITLIGAP